MGRVRGGGTGRGEGGLGGNQRTPVDGKGDSIGRSGNTNFRAGQSLVAESALC